MTARACVTATRRSSSDSGTTRKARSFHVYDVRAEVKDTPNVKTNSTLDFVDREMEGVKISKI